MNWSIWTGVHSLTALDQKQPPYNLGGFRGRQFVVRLGCRPLCSDCKNYFWRAGQNVWQAFGNIAALYLLMKTVPHPLPPEYVPKVKLGPGNQSKSPPPPPVQPHRRGIMSFHPPLFNDKWSFRSHCAWLRKQIFIDRRLKLDPFTGVQYTSERTRNKICTRTVGLCQLWLVNDSQWKFLEIKWIIENCYINSYRSLDF